MDVIDVAQRRQQEEIDHALAAARAAFTRQPGRATCAMVDCGEPISVCRTALGAQLCLDCQQRAEREAQQCAHGRG